MESLELSVFGRNITFLRDGIEDDVDNVALRFHEKDLIGEDVYQKATLTSGSTPAGRAGHLLMALKNRIRTEPTVYHRVIAILGSLPHLEHLVGPLQDKFQQLCDPQLQHDQHSESVSHSRVVATTPSSSLPYSGNRSVLVQGLPSLPRPLVADFRNVATPDAPISPSEQTNGGIPHQRPPRSSTADGSSAGESEDVSTVFQQPASEIPMSGASLQPSEYSSQKFKQEVQQKIYQAGDALNDLQALIFESIDQHRSDEIAQLEDQVCKLQLSKLEDAQRYNVKVNDAEKKAADAEEAVQKLRSILYTVTVQLEQKDKKITAQKVEICALKEDVKISQAEKEKSQTEAKEKEELIKKKELELQAGQTVKQQLEAELKDAQMKFKELEEKYCNLQEEVKSGKRKNMSWP